MEPSGSRAIGGVDEGGVCFAGREGEGASSEVEFQGSGGQGRGGQVVKMNGRGSGMALATDGTEGEAKWSEMVGLLIATRVSIWDVNIIAIMAIIERRHKDLRT